jgi:NADH dehydrogenase FAD-containing subunit
MSCVILIDFLIRCSAASQNILSVSSSLTAIICVEQVAMQQADCVAWNIHAGMTSGIPINFRYQVLTLSQIPFDMHHDFLPNVVLSMYVVIKNLTLYCEQKLGEMLTLGRSAASLASPLFGKSHHFPWTFRKNCEFGREYTAQSS